MSTKIVITLGNWTVTFYKITISSSCTSRTTTNITTILTFSSDSRSIDIICSLRARTFIISITSSTSSMTSFNTSWNIRTSCTNIMIASGRSHTSIYKESRCSYCTNSGNITSGTTRTAGNNTCSCVRTSCAEVMVTLYSSSAWYIVSRGRSSTSSNSSTNSTTGLTCSC